MKKIMVEQASSRYALPGEARCARIKNARHVIHVSRFLCIYYFFLITLQFKLE
jgi:hypothetical protein